MDNIEKLIERNVKYIRYALIGLAQLSGLSCLERPDNNVFLFLFLYYTEFSQHKIGIDKENKKGERLFTIITLGISVIIDCVWLGIFGGSNILSRIIGIIEVIVKLGFIGVLIARFISKGKTQIMDPNSASDRFNKLEEEE